MNLSPSALHTLPLLCLSSPPGLGLSAVLGLPGVDVEVEYASRLAVKMGDRGVSDVGREAYAVDRSRECAVGWVEVEEERREEGGDEWRRMVSRRVN